MDMHSREQYLESLREEYRRAGKKQKKRLLNEARKRTHLNRKVLIRKLAHPAKVPTSQKRAAAEGDLGRVEDWRQCSVGPAYLLLPVSVGSASLTEP
jgi:hypothetical protein